MALQTSSSFAGGAINAHIAAELLEIAHKAVVFQQLGEHVKLPAGEGKTFQFNRYERLALPLVPLTEGVPPASTNMALTTVSAVADQWGAYVQLSDVALLTIQHPLLAVAMKLLGFQAAELVEREVINVLFSGTSVSYGGTAATRSALGTDYMTDKVVQKAVAALRSRGAIPYDGQHFVGVLDPSVEQDISQATNTSFVMSAAYSNIKQLLNGELGTWRGVRWMTSNLIPVVQGYAAATASSQASPAGTFTAANYRVTVAYYDATTGLHAGLSQNANVAMGASNSLQVAIPANSAFIYKVFVSLAGAAATAALYQGSESTYGTGFIPAGATAVVLAPPTTGTAISGANIPATGVQVRFSWVFGQGAFAVVDLQNLQTYVSEGKATTVDPLAQQRTVGYKLMFKTVITNDAFLQRIETASEF